jgi:hypothetical protein
LYEFGADQTRGPKVERSGPHERIRSSSVGWTALRAADGVCGSIYSNFLPFVTSEVLKMYNDFERVLYASL